MNLLRWALGRQDTEKRYSLGDYANDLKFIYNGVGYAVTGSSASPWLKQEDIENSFTGYVQSAYKSDGIVFACMMARLRIFAQARFQWTTFKGAKPGPLFGTADLRVLERPWPNGSTSELLARMIQDADLAGQPYIAREGKRLRRLRPDWVSIILTAPPAEAVESDVAGYLYRPGGLASSAQAKIYLPDEVSHWTPIPDPEAQYRGMSWLTPVIREIQGDKAASLHKLKHFENAARPHLAVSFKESVTEDQFKAFMRAMNEAHQGPENAGKTLYLGGGADVTVLTHNMKELDYKAVTGAGETRIANAGGVPAVIVGLSEGLQGSSLNAGNYSAARRNFADSTLQDLWISACASLETVVPPPSGASLWFDKTEIPFLREDARDAAEILKEQMLSIESGIRGGFMADSVVSAVATGDLTALKHTGLFSVQLQPAGMDAPAAAAADAGRARRRRVSRTFDPVQPRDDHGRWDDHGMPKEISRIVAQLGDQLIDATSTRDDKVVAGYGAGDARQEASFGRHGAVHDLERLARNAADADVGETVGLTHRKERKDDQGVVAGVSSYTVAAVTVVDRGRYEVRFGDDLDDHDPDLLALTPAATMTAEELDTLVGKVERAAAASRFRANGMPVDFFTTTNDQFGVRVVGRDGIPVDLTFDAESWDGIWHAVDAVWDGLDERGRFGDPDDEDDIDEVTLDTNAGEVLIEHVGERDSSGSGVGELSISAADGSWNITWPAESRHDIWGALEDINSFAGEQGWIERAHVPSRPARRHLSRKGRR